MTPTPKKGDTSKRGTQNQSSKNPTKPILKEEDVVCEIIPVAMEHLPLSLIDAAIDKAVSKLAKRSPAGYRRRLLQGLAAGDEGWIETVMEFVKQVEATSEAPWIREKRLKREHGEAMQMALQNCGFDSPEEAYFALKEGVRDDF
ncbi:MAG: hypothetical protein M0P91_10530 [Sulfuricurvum sp.]|uniref:hypothetical protein n=1 Tax=Sulfuricurvum sp. TaxID=2025608 RepID=UPI0026004EF9|nr:hypothetical protein [Sulfuricurvum sp.]MCK9373625.1 hypothetical protein [Sulfuricurvum sp.]